MKVIIDGKEQEREVESVELPRDNKPGHIVHPKLNKGERVFRTIDGKVIIIQEGF